LDVPWSNGFTEGCNNKIKVLKRICFGVRNFRRFRNRILHLSQPLKMLPELSPQQH
jgi:transposase